MTNIIRDVKEDEELGRSYLPEEDRSRFPDLEQLLAFEAARARQYYAESRPLIGMVHAKSRSWLWALIEIYRRLLERIEASGYAVMNGRVRVPTWEKIAIIIRASLPGPKR